MSRGHGLLDFSVHSLLSIKIPVSIIDRIDLLGVNIDKPENLQFNGHVKNICTKVNNQVNVISGLEK